MLREAKMRAGEMEIRIRRMPNQERPLECRYRRDADGVIEAHEDGEAMTASAAPTR